LLSSIRTYISLPCRIGRTNIVKFSVYIFQGSVIWNLLFAFIGMQLGNNWEDIDNYSVYLEILLLAVCSGFVIWFIIKKPQDNFIHYLLLGDYTKDSQG